MIRKIPVPDLKVGMYIDKFDTNWLSHNFICTSFLIKNNKTLKKLKKSNLKFVYIDTDKSLQINKEINNASSVKENIFITEIGNRIKIIPAQEEVKQAKKIVYQANKVMKDMMMNIRVGKQVEIDQLDPVADKIVHSIMRNKYALVSLSRIKNKDDYTFMHSVSVSALMVALGRTIGMDDRTLNEIAVGGLLHDIGKMAIPNKILNKPAKLTHDEFVIMQDHVKAGQELLKSYHDLPSNITDVVYQHHEKIDGSGYPYKLHGDQLSTIGKMAAVVDVYDALTSIRVYKKAWEPSVALRKMMQLTNSHLDRQQVIHFIHCLGIYPVGSLVEMESGLVGVIQDQHENNLTHPIVKFIFKKNYGYIYEKKIDLAKETNDRIIRAASPSDYGIDLTNFL